MSEGDFNEAKGTFICNKCNSFISAVANKIFDKVNSIFSELKEEISNLKKANLDLKATLEMRNNDNVSQIVNNPTNIETHNTCEIKPVEVEKTLSDSKPCNVEKEIPKVNALYLCSIESQLSTADIDFILSDANISLQDINISQPNKDFKLKKYVIVTSPSSVKLFKFKVAFSSSNLNGTWFIRTTPPKSKTADVTSYSYKQNIPVPQQKYSNFNSNLAVSRGLRQNFDRNNNFTTHNNNQQIHQQANNSRHIVPDRLTHGHSHQFYNKNLQKSNSSANRGHFFKQENHAHAHPQNDTYANVVSANISNNNAAIVPFLENLLQNIKRV